MIHAQGFYTLAPLAIVAEGFFFKPFVILRATIHKIFFSAQQNNRNLNLIFTLSLNTKKGDHEKKFTLCFPVDGNKFSVNPGLEPGG